MKGEADHERGSECERSHRVGRADRKPLPQVVQADAERNEERGPVAERPAAPRALAVAVAALRPRSHASTPASPRKAPAAPSHTSAAPPKASAPVPAISVPSSSGLNAEEAEQADGERQQEADPATVHAADPWQPEHPDRHRDHADVDADQRHQAVEVEVGVRRLDRRLDRVVDRRPRGGEQHDFVVLSLDPRVVHVDLRPAETPDLVVRLGERREAVVHDHLAHLHGVGSVVADVQLDLARLQHGALDRELLLRRADPVKPRRVEQHEQPDRHREHGQRSEPSEPGRPTRRLCGGRLHHSVYVEEAHPAELRELAHVGVEHVLAGVREAQLEDAALALALDHRVGEVARLELRAGRVVVEEVGVDVERVQEVELERVHEVDAHELAALHLHRPLEVLERDGVDRVDLVRAVEVRVEPVHHHHELVGRRALLLRVDDERAVEALRDVLGERHRVAVVEVQAKGAASNS